MVVEGVERGKPFAVTNAKVEAKLCQFLPFVTVVGHTRRITAFNRDPVPHDIQGFVPDQPGTEKVLSRSSLRARGTTDVVRLPKGHHVFTMQCSMHPYMQSWGYAVDNPYYAVTDTEGAFTIDDLPPGTYRLKAWHPTLGAQEQELTVAPNEIISLDLSFEAKF
ncbi:MAG: carboxypeptidase regulatory-like domain-containing protein [Nitrospira sp.]